MTTQPAAPAIARLRDDCTREVFAVADALRSRTRCHRRLRHVTIVLPIDHAAVEAVELACLALADGELSEAAADLDRFLDRVTADPAAAEQFLQAVRSVVRRVGPAR